MQEPAELIEPVGDRILVKPEPEGETKKGSIVIPSTAQEKPQIGLILAMGPEEPIPPYATPEYLEWEKRHKKGQQLATGQRILYGKFSGTEITVEGEDYLILRVDDVLAILHSPAGGATTT